jgi:HEAT repeat protein
MRKIIFVYFLFICGFAYSQDVKDSRLDTIRYGTEAEIASLIQSLRNEKTDLLDDELIVLVEGTRNRSILTGVFAFFGEREKGGLEQRAVRAVVERDEEANETILSAIEYLGRMKHSEAVPVITRILDTEERRFLNASFRALGRASSGDNEMAEEAADFLIDYYNNRDPGDDNRSTVITAIGATGSSKGVSLLAGIASDTDERIPLRIAALDALSKIGETNTGDDFEGLDAILLCVGTNDPNVRAAAVAALGPFSGEAVDKAILDAFRDSYYRTRIAAAQASRDRKFAEAVPYLKYRAERDDVPNVRDEAIRALGAIANEEALEILGSLFYERKNSDRIRIAAGEMLMKNAADENIGKLITELDDAKTRNQTNLYNGFLKITGETVLSGDKSLIEDIGRRFLRSGTIVEKSYALDIAANNSLASLSTEITAVTKDRNESLARKAQRTAERLGIEISNEQN